MVQFHIYMQRIIIGCGEGANNGGWLFPFSSKKEHKNIGGESLNRKSNLIQFRV